LREYILVSQDGMRVERFVRQGDLWILSELTGPGAILSFESIPVSVTLADIYDRVRLPDDEDAAAPATEAPDGPS
jgi:hypothetical protein